MSSNGNDAKVEYTQSPEQRQIMQAVLPLLQGMGQYGQQRYFGGAPQMGAPSAEGVLTGVSPSTAMPTTDWWNSLAPQVKAGLFAPYVDVGQGLIEAMGSRGQTGSPQGGYSGAAGAALGELGSEAARDVGLNAWRMTAPAAMAAYQSGQQENMMDYNTAINVWNRPMQAMGMLGMGLPQGYVQNQSGNSIGGMFSGGLMGGLAGGSMFGPPGALGGGVLGGLGGLFS